MFSGDLTGLTWSNVRIQIIVTSLVHTSDLTKSKAHNNQLECHTELKFSAMIKCCLGY